MKNKILVHGWSLLFLSFIIPAQADTKTELGFGFFGQGDSVSFFGDTLDEVKNKKNLKDGLNCPRARFFIRGKKWDWFYRVMFEASDARILEAFVRYEEYPFMRISIGQEKIPFSLAFLDRLPVYPFLERPLASIALSPLFRTTLAVNFFKDPFTIALGLVGPEANNTIQNINIKGHTPLAGNSRLTFSPVHNEKETLHLAIAAMFQDSDSLGQFHFRTFPEVQSVHNHPLVDTGLLLNCKNYFAKHGEFLFIFKSFNLSSEYTHIHVNRFPEDLNFEGYYIDADFFLTGEHNVYNFKEGAIRSISKIKHDYGAWQFGIRYSYLNLTSNDVQGGRERNTTFGLNWIPNNWLKFMVNYIYVNTLPSDNGLDRHVNIFAIRCQLDLQDDFKL